MLSNALNKWIVCAFILITNSFTHVVVCSHKDLHSNMKNLLYGQNHAGSTPFIAVVYNEIIFQQGSNCIFSDIQLKTDSLSWWANLAQYRIEGLYEANRRLHGRIVPFFSCIYSVFPTRVSIPSLVRSVIFICWPPVSPLWWEWWKLRSAPCPLVPYTLQSIGTVCFACCAEWKLFPPPGRRCSPCEWAWERGCQWHVIKHSSSITSHSASWWQNGANTARRYHSSTQLQL